MNSNPSSGPALVGWVVDAQNDFMLPPERGGRLYVHDLFDGGKDPGATQILPALVRAVDWMHAHCAVVVYTGDWHAYGDEEIDPVAPDAAKGTYPPHCMGLSEDPEERRGAEVIDEIRPANPVVLARDASEWEASEVARTALRERRPIFIHKSRFSVFEGNPATDALLDTLRDQLGALEFVVAGVARDVCVKGAVEGFLDPARLQPVTLVTDATWGLGLESEAESLARWMGDGAALVTTRGLALRGPAASPTV
ncbi:cysteine hydrolase family protein [Longimicrobium sp.]|jgi:nicotinamidase-related amidase|uniref:cysteine hydrolase family protein n=1 Tax=Longimicrobium sp. TaxID=2029185 RepID=UPI002EDAA276